MSVRRLFALLTALGLLLLCGCGGAAPVSTASPRSTAEPTPTPAPTPVPEIPRPYMLEWDVEKTLLGEAMEIISPYYPYDGEVNPTQTEYLFGEDGFPDVFVFCQGGVVIHVDDYRDVPRPAAPYVGMPEEWIHLTALGALTETTHSSYYAAGELHVHRHYVLRDKDYIYFSVAIYNGFVSEITDYLDDPSPRLHLSFSSGAGLYDDPEALWYDAMDEYEDFDEAAEDWEEEYG